MLVALMLLFLNVITWRLAAVTMRASEGKRRVAVFTAFQDHVL